jgi:hypothetical protein
MARVVRGGLRERIAGDEVVPFRGGPHEDFGLEAGVLRDSGLNPRLERRRRTARAVEDQIPALQERPRPIEPERGEQRAKVGHRDHAVPPDVDAAKERDPGHRPAIVPHITRVCSKDGTAMM